jgi:DNA (cytosine-5)-methyltransferase 1
MSAYYNEFDPFAAAWLRELIKGGHIADGEVDDRSIELVRPDDLRGFTQCHFFAGIGGWSYALRLAGWPDTQECWSGSCPCQPFSSASNRDNTRTDDAKHLWPALGRLVIARAPPVIFGEQIAQAGDWFAEVCADLENGGYEIGAAILPAVALGFDHARARLYFVGHANSDREPIVSGDGPQVDRMPQRHRLAGALVPAHGVSRIMAGFGNAIVPAVAAAFIEAYMSTQR